MPPLPEFSAEFQRSVILLAPFMLAGGAILIRQPDGRAVAGAFLAMVWNFVMLVPANIFAVHMGWWSFGVDDYLLMGVPWDVMLGWSVWWGAALFLSFGSRRYIGAFLTALWIDVLFMPRLSPLVDLGEAWLWGEGLVMAVCLVPGWMLAAATARDIHVGWRAAAQALMTGLLLLFLLPAALLHYSGRDFLEMLMIQPAWKMSILLNILLLPVVLGLAGNQEFAERGQGTPIPFDPPKRLVVTGPY